MNVSSISYEFFIFIVHIFQWISFFFSLISFHIKFLLDLVEWKKNFKIDFIFRKKKKFLKYLKVLLSSNLRNSPQTLTSMSRGYSVNRKPLIFQFFLKKIFLFTRISFTNIENRTSKVSLKISFFSGKNLLIEEKILLQR